MTVAIEAGLGMKWFNVEAVFVGGSSIDTDVLSESEETAKEWAEEEFGDMDECDAINVKEITDKDEIISAQAEFIESLIGNRNLIGTGSSDKVISDLSVILRAAWGGGRYDLYAVRDEKGRIIKVEIQEA